MNIAGFFISMYLAGAVVFIILALLTWFVIDKRLGKGHGISVPPGYEPTEEISIDPSNGKKYRVYYNPDNGARFYREEK